VIAPSPRFDVRDLHRFGTVSYLVDCSSELNPLAGQSTIQRIDELFKSAKFNPRHDMLALTGPVALVAYVLATLVAAFDEPVRVLVFDARAGGSYRLQTIDPQ
jgi:hypothetical protein